MSLSHVRLDRRRWAHVRRKALVRAGFRSEKSGKAGRLEVDHIKPLELGGAPYAMSNLQVLTRAEHIEKTRRENRRRRKPQGPAAKRWGALVGELRD